MLPAQRRAPRWEEQEAAPLYAAPAALSAAAAAAGGWLTCPIALPPAVSCALIAGPAAAHPTPGSFGARRPQLRRRPAHPPPTRPPPHPAATAAMAPPPPLVTLNVGSALFPVLRATLTARPGSLLSAMFSGNWEPTAVRDEAGRVDAPVPPAPTAARAPTLTLPAHPPVLTTTRLQRPRPLPRHPALHARRRHRRARRHAAAAGPARRGRLLWLLAAGGGLRRRGGAPRLHRGGRAERGRGPGLSLAAAGCWGLPLPSAHPGCPPLPSPDHAPPPKQAAREQRLLAEACLTHELAELVRGANAESEAAEAAAAAALAQIATLAADMAAAQAEASAAGRNLQGGPAVLPPGELLRHRRRLHAAAVRWHALQERHEAAGQALDAARRR